MITYKEFIKWCNMRACDGRWSYLVAMFCISVMKELKKVPFWKRNRQWQRLNVKYNISDIVIDVNRKIGCRKFVLK